MGVVCECWCWGTLRSTVDVHDATLLHLLHQFGDNDACFTVCIA